MAEFDFEVVIVGGGVVGLALAAELATRSGGVALFERHNAFGQETSSRNSEVIHAGLYYKPGSLKARLCVEGARMLYAYCERHGIPHRRVGKWIVAVTDQEALSLEQLYRTGLANGVEGLRLASKQEVLAREPRVRAEAGLWSSQTGVVDSHRFMARLAEQARAGGGVLAYGAETVALECVPGGWCVGYRDTSGVAAVRARAVVNAAGLGAQAVMRMAGLDPEALNVRLYLAKGEYFAVAGPKRHWVRGLVYPSPAADLVGLGIHTVVDLGGGVKLGPNAFYVDTIDYRVDPAHRHNFWENAHTYLPFLEENDLTPDMAGIRPKLAGPGQPARDFYIAHEAAHGAPGFFNLAGIESPGLTSALAMARHVRLLMGEYLKGA